MMHKTKIFDRTPADNVASALTNLTCAVHRELDQQRITNWRDHLANSIQACMDEVRGPPGVFPPVMEKPFELIDDTAEASNEVMMKEVSNMTDNPSRGALLTMMYQASTEMKDSIGAAYWAGVEAGMRRHAWRNGDIEWVGKPGDGGDVLTSAIRTMDMESGFPCRHPRFHRFHTDNDVSYCERCGVAESKTQ